MLQLCTVSFSLWYIAAEECHQDWEIPGDTMWQSEFGGTHVCRIQIDSLLPCLHQSTPIFKVD